MNIADRAILCILLLAFILFQAHAEAKLFKANKPTSHFEQGLVYGIYVGLIAIAYSLQFNWWYLLKVGLYGLIIRAAFFDIVLNLLRKEPITYTGTPGSSTDESKIDQIVRRIPVAWQIVLRGVLIFLTVLVFLFIK